MDVKDLDRQYVAGLGIRHRDGASERVEAVPVKSVEGVYGGVWPYLSVRDLAGVVDDRVYRLDREHRLLFFFSSRRRHTRYWRDWSSDVCSSDLGDDGAGGDRAGRDRVR